MSVKQGAQFFPETEFASSALMRLLGRDRMNLARQCLTEGQLEDYVFGRVADEALSEIEEHLLVCADCQDRLQDEEEYVAAFRAAARVRTTPVQWYRPLAAAAAIVMAVGLAVPLWNGSTAVDTVDLLAERGGALVTVATVRADHRPALRVDLTGLEQKSVQRLQIVNVKGDLVAENPASASSEKTTWTLGKRLDAGTYWVRVLDGNGTPVREFQFNVE